MKLLKTLLLALGLSLSSLAAQAGVIYKFDGSTDAGSLPALPFSLSFGIDSVAADFSGFAPLTSFSFAADSDLDGSLDLVFELANADDPAAAVAWFEMGSLLGVDYVSGYVPDASGLALTAPFFLGDLQFIDIGLPGGPATLAVNATEAFQAVPLPGSLALAGLGLLALARRRRA